MCVHGEVQREQLPEPPSPNLQKETRCHASLLCMAMYRLSSRKIAIWLLKPQNSTGKAIFLPLSL